MIALLLAAPGASAAQLPSPWTWVDRGPALRAVSCAAPGACVAVGQQGVVLRSTPGLASPLAWSGVRLTYPAELVDVTCTGPRCLAISNSRTKSATFASSIYRSTDAGATWSAPIPLEAAGPGRTRSAAAIACDPATTRPACYAVGPTGGIWRSTDDGRSWDALAIGPNPTPYTRIACPARGTCVATGSDTRTSSAIVEGTDVTPVPLPAGIGKGLLALACDTATRCTTTDGLGHVTSLSIPDRRWSPARLLPKGMAITELACPLEDTCIGLTDGAVSLRTTTLSSPTGGWTRRPLGTLNLAALDCATTACVAVGKAGTWFASLDAGFGWGRVNEVAKFDTILCSAAFDGTCVAGGEKDLGVSRARGELWSLPMSGYAGLNVKSITCTGPSECLFLGKTQTLFTSDLAGFGVRHPTIVDPKGTDALTCVTAELCVGLNEGVAYTTFDGALTDWTQNGFPDQSKSIACVPGRTDPVVCVAATRDFIVRGTMTRTDGRVLWSWIYTDADPDSGIEGIACSPGGQCSAVNPSGEILTTTDASLLHWTARTIPDGAPVSERPALKTVACPADGVCLAGGVHGADAIIATTTNTWADYTYDAIEGLEGGAPTVKGFGCESIDRCVAVGDTALIGVRRPD